MAADSREQDLLSVKYPKLLETIRTSPVVTEHGGYSFNKYAFGERGRELDTDLIREIKGGFLEKIEPFRGGFGYIVAPEPGGNQWGLLIASELGVALKIVRTQASGEPEEAIKRQVGGSYYDRNLYFSGLRPGDRAIVIDDVLSSGTTAQIIVETLNEKGVTVAGVFAIATKGDGYKKVEESSGVPIHSLVHLAADGKTLVP
ncbi:phosphoribosyltransferase [Candidatus Curtissbacteria bacterium]|nr:phosphoribosyltransferase [Candidatus Curtissbacteria bacterium]